MNELLFFPLSNEHGFRIDSRENYQHMIETIIDTQVELALDYPDDTIMVIFELEDE